MFVPVSPSGTGYTFRSSIRRRLRSSEPRAAWASSRATVRSLMRSSAGRPGSARPRPRRAARSDARPRTGRVCAAWTRPRSVEAVFDDDAQLDRDAVLTAAFDGDALTERVARQQAL